MKKLVVGVSILLVLLAGCAGSSGKQEKESASKKTDEITIYFVRHGKTMLNTVDRSQGWIDAPLTPAGIDVAEKAGRGLKKAGITFDKVYTSTSGRAMETAEFILKNNGQEGKKYTRDKRLREYNFGTYEGMPNQEMWTAVAESEGKTFEELMSDMKTDGFYQSILHFADTLSAMDKNNVKEGVNWPAEDSKTIIKRLKSALDDITADAKKSGDKNILVVSHGMSIITLLGELDKNAKLPVDGLKNASVSKVVYKDGKYRIDTVNDTSFVDKG